MAKGDAIAKLVVAIIVIWLFLYIFYEIARAGVKGKDATFHRCGNCNMVLRPNQSPCPNCGYIVRWV